MVSHCSACGGACHDKCITKVGGETAYRDQEDWVCPACKLLAVAEAQVPAVHPALLE